MIDDPHTEYDNSGLVNPDGWMQQLWHKCTTSAECKTIRIAASAVMDGWIGCTWPLSSFTLKMIEKGDLTMNCDDHEGDLVNK